MVETFKLNNGVEMPKLGFGVFQIDDAQQCEQAVLDALKVGYRLIDTAATYGNERAVGKAIVESDVPRSEIFISSKVWIQDAGYEKTKASFEKTLANLQTDYLDLYLIHMPLGDYHGSWRAMEELYEAGKIKSIGVCNFEADQLIDLILSHHVKPAVDQLELHPFWQQNQLRDVMAKYEVQPMAWAPFAEGKHQLFTDPTLTAIGKKYGKTAAQVTLRWLIQNNIVAIPKSVHTERMQQNFDVSDFSLSNADLIQVNDLDLKEPAILDIHRLTEVYRLHGIKFEQ
ncbi:aldo/keto reductase [Furfurilactobacillus milii]|uniref:aldo/keto reductase n=1 Tax=Furfurilactobacillus milii TaxID=2888272 RepID=UPI0015B82988|nr:aldo/keto reductase [Furfurilactobacillus milii]MCF6160295.1 aldo/keto reductase [Furfurilactobacillus milii]MCF6162238.1 aldo/keto reductase [Furfurilactobacillus milii]QLE65794.1 25-diketo-D-gluconic acid reductase [Furfurilactobacillus rossiae]